MNYLPRDPFASISTPFLELYRPDEHGSVITRKKPRTATFHTVAPDGSELGANMIHFWGWPWEWAISYGPYRAPDGDHGAGWRTFITGRISSAGRLRGYPMRLLDVYRHLSGHSYSVGMTNRVRSDWLQQEQNAHRERCYLDEGRAVELWNPNGILTEDELVSSYLSDIDQTYWEHRFLHRETDVRSIRIDIDSDDVWRDRDATTLRAQVRACAGLAEQLGLGFSVFRTGGRGIQAIYALPWAQSPLSASWLAMKLRDALSVRLAGMGAVVDCDSTRAILRLPLGLHAKSGLLGLFLCPISGEILPAEDQVRLATQAFTTSERDPECVSALRSIRAAFDGAGDCLSVVTDEIENRAWERLPVHGEFLRILRDGIGVGLTGRGRVFESQAINLPVDDLSACSHANNGCDDLPADFRERAWAIWNRGYGPGGSNAFHVNGGIAIAKLLFGDSARERLRAQAEQTPYHALEDLTNRYSRIGRLLKEHEIGLLFSIWSGVDGHEASRPALPDPEEADVPVGKRLVIAYRKVLRALGRKVQKRTLRVVEAVALVVVAAITRGNGIVSSRSLVSKLAERGVQTNRTTVSEILDVLSAPASTSGLPPAALLEWIPIQNPDPLRKPLRRYSLASLH